MAAIEFSRADMDALFYLAQRLGLPIPDRPAHLAVLVRVIRFLPDEPAFFPRGQHALIQECERQLDEWASAYAERRAFNRESFDERAR